MKIHVVRRSKRDCRDVRIDGSGNHALLAAFTVLIKRAGLIRSKRAGAPGALHELEESSFSASLGCPLMYVHLIFSLMQFFFFLHTSYFN